MLPNRAVKHGLLFITGNNHHFTRKAASGHRHHTTNLPLGNCCVQILFSVNENNSDRFLDSSLLEEDVFVGHQVGLSILLEEFPSEPPEYITIFKLPVIMTEVEGQEMKIARSIMGNGLSRN